MNIFSHAFRLSMAMLLAWTTAGLPSCASMGGGMRYSSPEPMPGTQHVVAMGKRAISLRSWA